MQLINLYICVYVSRSLSARERVYIYIYSCVGKCHVITLNNLYHLYDAHTDEDGMYAYVSFFL